MRAEILQNLRTAVLDYDCDAAAMWAKRAIEAEVDPTEALDALTQAIRQVGDAFGKGDLWLPDLVGAAAAMQGAVPLIEQELKRQGKRPKSLGVVVIGTVFGDIHTIGKSLVGTALIAEGFEVHDLGINVAPARFIEAVKEYRPSVLAMSALLTSTAPQAKAVIDALRAEGLRDSLKVMVGGGAITPAFATSIGADGYDPTAPGAVAVARGLVGI